MESKIKDKYILIPAIIISLFLRVVLPFKTIFGHGAIRFASSDSYYFANGVRELEGCISPDQAFFTKVLYGFSGISPFSSEIDIIILPIILHILTIVAVYLLARNLFNNHAAVFSTIFFVLLPGEYLSRSLVGNIDYHSTEVALTTIGMLGVVVFLSTKNYKWKMAGILGGSVSLYLYSLTWSGHYIFLAILGIFAVIVFIRILNKRIITIGLIILGIAIIGRLAQSVIGFPGTSWQVTSEARPLLTGNVPFITLLSIVITAACVISLWLEYRRKKDNRVLLFIIWSSAIIAATLLQRRFDYYLVVNAALAMGYLLNKLAMLSGKHDLKIPAAVLFVACMVILPLSVRVGSQVTAAPTEDWVNALEWVKDNTPENTRVVAWWDYGYWIEYIAERKPVADPSQDPEKLKEVADILTAAYITPDISTYMTPDIPPAIYPQILSMADILILDGKTMDSNYKNVEIRAQRSGGESLARQLWEGKSIEGCDLIYINSTLKIYKGIILYRDEAMW